MAHDPRPALESFVEYVSKLEGDEKGEAQVFLDRLFQAFGHAGYKEAGAILESRVRATGKGTRFADLLWSPRALIEMKKRGENLLTHYDQARDYWHDTYPKPRYVVLCNFDEFWIYDFFNQSEPVDTLRLEDIPQRYLALNFLFPSDPKPQFGKDRVKVSREAAASIAAIFNSLVGRNEDRERAQRFILQCVFCLFAEDFDLLPRGLFSGLIEDCRAEQASAFDLFGSLFSQMNNREQARGGRFRNVDYFNGGLFSIVDPIDLNPYEIDLLVQASNQDWSLVQPPIFGALFEGSMDKDQRHAFGAHFTAEADIKKVVRPTIERPWSERIEAAKTLKELNSLREQLLQFQVLDPACGCGNFLYIAYRELRRLEMRILLRIHEEFGQRARKDAPLEPKLSLRQFHGIDILPFAVELTKLTLMLGKEQAIRETKETLDQSGIEADIFEQALPLDNLDSNIICDDALFCKWPKADVIIGNPPFLGAKHLKPEHGSKYIEFIRQTHPGVPGLADFCVYWFRKAHDHLPKCTPRKPSSGRAGLVGTQNIRNNQSRVGGLEYILKTGAIVEAVDNQPWSGEANVHVSIANWAKTQDSTLLPEKRRLYFKVDPHHSGKRGRTRGTGPATKEFQLDFRECAYINSALSDKTDTTIAARLKCNFEPPVVFRGLEPGNMGFIISPEQAKEFLITEPQSVSVISPYLNGRELVSGQGQPERWLIDFQKMSVLDAMAYPKVFQHIKDTVLRQMTQIASSEEDPEAIDVEFKERITKRQLVPRLNNWWQLRRCVPETVMKLSSLTRYVACSMVTKRPIFIFLSGHIRPSNLLQSFALSDDYSFGILQSRIHWQWFVTRCSKLKSDFRYTADGVFDTFPWPQSPALPQVMGIARAAVELRLLRDKVMQQHGWSLRDLYRTLETPGSNPLRDAHEALDEAVRAAYGMKKNADPLAFLLDLNQQVAEREGQLLPVTGPGLPPCVNDPKSFITDDCIRVRNED